MLEYVSDFGLGSLGQEPASSAPPFIDASEQRIANLTGGGFVVSYEVEGTTFLRIYDANGVLRAGPIAIDANAIPDFDLAGLPGGGFVAVWVSASVNVQAQYFDANGTATSAVISIDGTNNREQQPDVTVLDDGNVLVAWRANTATPSILARVLGPNGAFVSDIFTASQTEAIDVFFPQIDALPGGGFVVSWSENFRVAAQVYNTARAPVGATIILPEAVDFLQQQFQSVEALPDGRFVIVWNEVDPSSTDRILAAIYTPEGAIIGAPFQVNTDARFNTGQPDLEVFADGSFMVAWRLAVPGNGPNSFQIGDIRAQRFDTDGQRLGGEFQVNELSGEGQDGPLIAGFGSGDVAVIWRNWTDNPITSDVQLRIFYSVTNGTNDAEIIAGTAGVDFLRGLDGGDVLSGGLGNDVLDGGGNVDTAVVSGLRSSYTITQTSTGVFQVVGADGTDTLTAIEFLQFDDQILRLRPGTGVSVNFNTADPSVYQSALNNIRDFDGNALGGNGSWLRIGSADVNGDGDIDQIIVNRALGRFATVGTAPDGLVYFSDHGWAGETRVAGIYIDPFVANGTVQPGSPNDSQRRFQNDLQIENINRVLGANDYDRDGGQEVFFALTDGTAYLRAVMHADGNIRFADYRSQQQVIDYLTANGFGPETYAGWFPTRTSGEGSLDAAQDISTASAALLPEAADITALPGTAGGELLFNPLGLAHGPIMSEYLVAEFYG